MVRLIIGFFLLIVLVSIAVYTYKKNNDIFHPLCLMAFWTALRYVPHILDCEYESFIYLTDQNVFKVFVIQLISVLAVCIGYLFGNSIGRKKDIKISRNYSLENISIKKKVISSFTIYLIGMSASFYKIIQSGGIETIRANTSYAYSQLSNGSGLVTYLSYFMLLAILLMINIYGQTKRKKYLVYSLFMGGIYAFSFFIYSSRTQTVYVIVLILVGLNYLHKKILLKDFIKPKLMMVFIVVLVIVLLGPSIRTRNFEKDNVQNIVKQETSNIFDQFSYVGRDAFTYDYFNINNFWFGKGYLNLTKALIPSAVYPNKPPIDDGIYLFSLISGFMVSPTQGRLELPVKYSIPFTASGISYANFGLLGVLVSQFLTGIIYRYIYVYLGKNKNAFVISVYFWFVWGFAWSVSSIFSVVMYTVFTYIAWKIYGFLLRIKL